MCIIAHCTEKRINAKMLHLMIRDNSDGIGIAWQEKGSVHWKKGIQSVRKAMRILKKLPLPYVVHARFATVGMGAQLAHPFSIESFPQEGLEGTSARVLFHNGHVHDWRALHFAAHGIALPFPDRWSDSRAIASVVAHSGERILDSIDGSRFLIMDGKKIRKWGRWIEEYGISWSTQLPSERVSNWWHGIQVNGKAETRKGEFSSNRWTESADDWDRLDNWDKYANQDNWDDGMTKQGDD